MTTKKAVVTVAAAGVGALLLAGSTFKTHIAPTVPITHHVYASSTEPAYPLPGGDPRKAKQIQ